MQPVHLAVEGRSDEPVAEKLLEVARLASSRVWILGGKTKLDPKLPGLNASATLEWPWLVLRDLDHDDRDTCVPELRSHLLGSEPNDGMCFRIAVRAMEAWLLADHRNCAEHFGIVPNRMPNDVEALSDPKETLVNLCRRSKNGAIRQRVVPREDAGRKVGPEYNATVSEFAREVWNPNAARANSPSLDRAMLCLERLRVRLLDQS